MRKRKSTAIAFPLAKLETRHNRSYDLTLRNSTQNVLNSIANTLIYSAFNGAKFFLKVAAPFVCEPPK